MATHYHAGEVAATLKSKNSSLSSKFCAVFESGMKNKVNITIDQSKDEQSATKPERKQGKRKVNFDDKIEKKIKKKFKKDDPEINARTLFVGNVPTTIEKKDLRDLFKPYGDIETIRFRSAPTPDPKTTKKVAVIHKIFNPNRHNINAFVKFKVSKSAEEARKLNGYELNGFILRVDLASNGNKNNEKKSIFVGNLPFDIEENILYKYFEEYGSVESVRIIRDKISGIGKGFGYINFKSQDSVHLALKMTAKPLNGRTLRIKRSMTKSKLDAKNKSMKKIIKSGIKWKKEKKSTNDSSFQGEMAKLKIKKKNKFKKRKNVN